MRDLVEIKAFAIKQYNSFLISYFNGIDIFPLTHNSFRKYSRGELQKKFQQIEEEIEILIENSKERIGYGYEIVWEEINSRSVGTNKYPKTIQFNTQLDYLKFISKENEFNIFCEDANLLVSKFPALREWLSNNPASLISISENLDKIISICEYFQKHPRPDLYLRELPIEGVDTKFIEANGSILKVFLDRILSSEGINLEEESFEARYFLKQKQSLIRFRILDSEMNKQFPGGLLDITLTFDEFKTLQFPEDNIFITENLINFLVFPSAKNSLIILGSGYNVVNLRKLDNLKSKTFYYWGDLDSHGFDILARLRDSIPFATVHSFLMNVDTYEKFSNLATNSNKFLEYEPANLLPEELDLFRYLNSQEKGNRLEQEKIPIEYIRACLKCIETLDRRFRG